MKIKPLKIKLGEHKGDVLSVSNQDDSFIINFDCDEQCFNFDEVIFGEPQNARDVGEWLIKVADWAEGKQKRRNKNGT